MENGRLFLKSLKRTLIGFRVDLSKTKFYIIQVIHGDLAARNVLVDQKGVCKLTGIGEHPLVFDKDTYATRKKVYRLTKANIYDKSLTENQPPSACVFLFIYPVGAENCKKIRRRIAFCHMMFQSRDYNKVNVLLLRLHNSSW